MQVDWRATAAGAADLKRAGGCFQGLRRFGGHIGEGLEPRRLSCHDESRGATRPGDPYSYAPKELPQPQVDFAFGLLNTKPLLIKLVS
jgi:hypothetical protein